MFRHVRRCLGVIERVFIRMNHQLLKLHFYLKYGEFGMHKELHFQKGVSCQISLLAKLHQTTQSVNHEGKTIMLSVGVSRLQKRKEGE